MTNYPTIQKRIRRLKELEKMEENGTFEVFAQKGSRQAESRDGKAGTLLGGIKDMPGLPGAIFVIDPRKEHIAIAECRRLGIPIVAIVDTNCDPDENRYTYSGNDDAIRAVKLLTAKMADAVLEANQGQTQEEAQLEAATEEAEEETAAAAE